MLMTPGLRGPAEPSTWEDVQLPGTCEPGVKGLGVNPDDSKRRERMGRQKIMTAVSS